MIALAIAAGASALPIAAHAQFFGDRYPFDQPNGRQPPPPPRGYFSFPFFDHPYNNSPYSPPPTQAPSQAPVESYKAPTPRRPAGKPANTVVVIGDSLADWLAYGLEEVYSDTPDAGVVRRVRPTFGLVRTESHSDTPEWLQEVKDILATEKPSAIVVMLGLNDRLSLRETAPVHAGTKPPPANPPGQVVTQPGQPAPPAQTAQPAQPAQQGQDTKPAVPAPDAAQPAGEQPPDAADTPRLTPGRTYDFRTDQWAELYEKRVGEMIAALKSKGVPVLWVGLPAIRGSRATGDMNYLDDLYRESAEKAGIVYVNIWDGFVDENGRYTVEGPDFEGQTRRLRASDGIHFTKFGALKLAHLVDLELSRIMSNHVAPAALPSPEATAPVKPGTVRPAVGPVLPLTANGGGEGGDLMGAGSHSAPASSDPAVTSVLVRGDALAAPAGRADDFSWPPRATEAKEPPQATPPSAAPAAPAPAVPVKKTSAGGNGGRDLAGGPPIDAAAAAPAAH
jgi:uncharacterized protein